jgi:hypothetical protein
VEVFVRQGRELGFIRPSRRTIIKAPHVNFADMVPLPEGLVLVLGAWCAKLDMLIVIVALDLF